MNRTEKTELVESLQQVFQTARLVVVTQNTGLTVAEMSFLRREMRAAGGSFKVTKNRLARLALKGTQFEPLADHFRGPTAIACSDDPVAAAKVAVDYAQKNNKLVVLGGAMEATVLDAPGVKALATLPPLEEVRAKLLGLLMAPASKLASVIQAPGAGLARVVNAHAKKGEAA